MSELINFNANITFDHASLGTAKADQREAERVVRAVQYLNRTAFSTQNQSSSALAFTYDAATQRAIVKVIDQTTGDVLYQMPSHEVLRMAADVRKSEKLKSTGQERGSEEETSG